MPSAETDLERRLTELEVKACYTDDLLEALNTQVAQQQDMIARLVQEIVQLRQREPSAEGPAFRSLRDELPPHY
jgi:SlyX protein